jgi:hypothetical protein
VFLKNNISRDELLVCREIKEFVSFDTKRITQKDTTFSSRVKFGSLRTEDRSKPKTSNGSKMRKMWNFMKK